MSALRQAFVGNYDSLQGPGRRLGALHLVDSVGNGLFLAGSTAFWVLSAGLPATTVGLGLSLAGLAGFLSSLVTGHLADRFPASHLLAVLLGLLALSFSFYPLVDSTPAFLVLISVVGALEYGCGPVFGALVLDLTDEDTRVEARAALRSLFNIGFSAGALLAAALLGAGGDWLNLLPAGNALTYLAAAVMVLGLPKVGVQQSGAGSGRLQALKDGDFLAVVGLSSVLALHSAVLLVGLPLWILSETDLPSFVIPAVLLINTVSVILLQVRFSRGAETVTGAAGLARLSGFISAGACLLLAAAGAGSSSLLPLLAAGSGATLLTLSELWQSSSAFGLAYGLAGQERRGQYLGAFNLHVVAQGTFGPAVVTAAVVSVGAGGWLLLAVLFLGSGLLIAPAAARAARDERLLAPSAQSAATTT